MTTIVLWIVMTVCNMNGTQIPNYQVFETRESAEEFASLPIVDADQIDCKVTILRAEAPEWKGDTNE